MPFFEKRIEQVDELEKYSGCDYLFCHSDLNGAKMHLTSVAHKNNDKIDVDNFTGYKSVMTGHIHIRQKINNITFVGSIFQMDRNDMYTEKGISVLDTNTGEEIFYENKISPIFKEVYIRTIEDIENMDNISTKDYIDLYISNSLLVNNRKLRRKLESLLEVGNFSSIDYIDDINVTTSEEIEKINEDMNENISSSEEIIIPKLEYKELIKDHILSLKYDTTKIKNGVISEYNEVIRIYDEGYKKK